MLFDWSAYFPMHKKLAAVDRNQTCSLFSQYTLDILNHVHRSSSRERPSHHHTISPTAASVTSIRALHSQPFSNIAASALISPCVTTVRRRSPDNNHHTLHSTFLRQAFAKSWCVSVLLCYVLLSWFHKSLSNQIWTAFKLYYHVNQSS